MIFLKELAIINNDVIINNKLKDLNVNNIKNTTNNDFETIWIKTPYLGDKGDQFLKSLIL